MIKLFQVSFPLKYFDLSEHSEIAVEQSEPLR